MDASCQSNTAHTVVADDPSEDSILFSNVTQIKCGNGANSVVWSNLDSSSAYKLLK